MNSKRTAIALIALGIAVGIAIPMLRPGKTDQQLIEAALVESIEAGKEGRPGSVLEHLSNSFEINGQSIVNRDQIARYIRDNKPDVEIETTVAIVDGSNAHINSPVKLELSGPIKFSATIPGVRIEFQKENTTKFLVFPDHKWRLTKVTVPPDSWSQMLGF